MTIIEPYLVILLLVTLVISTYTDCKYGLIYNKQIAYLMLAAVIGDVAYYSTVGAGYLGAFLVNFGMLTFLSIFLYLCHVWAAGDSKLLIVIALMIPGRLLVNLQLGAFQSFLIVIFSFITAVLYTFIESVILTIKRSVFYTRGEIRFHWMRIVGSYLFVAGGMLLLSDVLSMIYPEYVHLSVLMLASINFVCVMALMQVRDRLTAKSLLIAAIIIWTILVVLSIATQRVLMVHYNLSMLIYAFITMLLVSFSSRYNYKTIPTETVTGGQILSLFTIASFQGSRVKGLPTGCTEDMRSRITAKEAESVRRWGKSAKGNQTVVIVRKLPFAMFISVGTVLFLIVEAAALWQ